jgi:hypothetical protein
MAKEIIDIEVQSNIKSVSNDTENLNTNLKKTAKAGKEAGSEISGGMQIANAGMGMLDRVTGGLATKFMEVGKASMKSGKAMKAALISSGIGLAVAAISLLVQHWDAIGEALGFINKDLEKQKELNEENLRVVDSQVGLLEKQIKFNKDRGIANEENLKTHQDLLITKQGILATGLQILEAQLELEKSVVHEQGWWDEWGKFLGYKGKSKATLAALAEESAIRINDLMLAINKLKGEQLDLENILNPVRTPDSPEKDRGEDMEKLVTVAEDTSDKLIKADNSVLKNYLLNNAIKRRDAKITADAEKAMHENTFAAVEGLAANSEASSQALSAAKTIYNTQQAIMNTMANVPAPWNIVQSAITGAMGLRALAAIKNTSSATAMGGGVATAPPAPQMMSGAFELTGGQEVEPARAYVVSDDITNNQNKLAIIRRRATI